MTLVGAPVALNSIGWKFYLVLIVPSAVYIVIQYFLFPETKGRTLEEIGDLFGDNLHVASHWYSATEEEREQMKQEALRETQGGRVSEKKPGERCDTHMERLADTEEEKGITVGDGHTRNVVGP